MACQGPLYKNDPRGEAGPRPSFLPCAAEKTGFSSSMLHQKWFCKSFNSARFFFHISQPRTWVLNTNPKRISIVYFDGRFGFNKDFFLLCRFSGFRCFTYDWIYSCWYFTQEKSLQRMHGTISHQCRISRIQKSTGPQLSLKTCFWIIKRLWHQITNLELLLI